MDFLWISCGLPYGLPVDFLWISSGFPMDFLPYQLPMDFLWMSFGFPIDFSWILYGFWEPLGRPDRASVNKHATPALCEALKIRV